MWEKKKCTCPLVSGRKRGKDECTWSMEIYRAAHYAREIIGIGPQNLVEWTKLKLEKRTVVRVHAVLQKADNDCPVHQTAALFKFRGKKKLSPPSPGSDRPIFQDFSKATPDFKWTSLFHKCRYCTRNSLVLLSYVTKKYCRHFFTFKKKNVLFSQTWSGFLCKWVIGSENQFYWNCFLRWQI